MQTSIQNGGGHIDASVALDTEHSSSETTANGAAAHSRRKPRWVMRLRHLGDGRVWMDLTAGVLPETKRTIDALLAEEDRRFGEPSIDALAADSIFESRWVMLLRDAGSGRVRMNLTAQVLPATKKAIAAVLAEEDQKSYGLSIDDLAAELNVTRRTVERRLKDGVLISTGHKGKRVRFSREYVDKLKIRAEEARADGRQRTMRLAAGSEPKVRVRRSQISPEERAAATLWKLRNPFPIKSTKSRAVQRRKVPWLEKREGGMYCVYWYDETHTPPRTMRRSTGTRDPAEAKKWYVAFLAGGPFIPRPAGLTVSAALDNYMQEYVETKVVDQKRAADAIKHLKAWFGDELIVDIDIPASRLYALARSVGVIGGGTRLGKADYENPAFITKIQEFKVALEKLQSDAALMKQKLTLSQALGLASFLATRPIEELEAAAGSSSTIRRELGVLNAVANHNSKWKRIGPKASPPTSMPSLELPAETVREEIWLTHAELAVVLGSATGRLKDFLTLLYYTGARRASIERLTRFQVDLKAGRINLSSPKETAVERKSKKRRPVVPLFPETRPIVERLMEVNKDSEYLFGDPRDMYRDFVHHLVPRHSDFDSLVESFG